MHLYWTFQDEHRYYLLLEYCPGGDLSNLLKKYKKGMDEEWVKVYAAEIAIALGSLHEAKIIYRDVKPANILLGKDGHCKLTDFGISKKGI